MLATYSLMPILRTFTAPAGIEVVESDISVAARVLAEFPEHLTDEQRVPDNLGELGRLAKAPEANIIKLPNISASVPQLVDVVQELQGKGYNIPDYPEDAKTEIEKAIRARYSRVLGSAVNPVLREGNSDRRAPAAVKRFARKKPHSMAEWSPASRTHVSHMWVGDFYHSEKSMTLTKACDVKMDLVTKTGQTITLKPKVSLIEGEIIDSMFMSKNKLCDFFEKQLQDAKKTGVMFSLHVKATMMKISHPIVFGHAVKVFYKDVFAKHGKLFDELGVQPNNGISSVYDKIQGLPGSQREEIEHDIHACYESRPELAMVDSARGISNLHAPNDVIVDASMPAMIRVGGKMYGPDGKLKDTKAVMPESTFARIYQEVIDFCKYHGAFDPTTMGTVPNVGLMAQQAEEYGSHDKTFEISEDGVARVVDFEGNVLLEQNVEAGDIWRMCQTKDAPIRDWVKLAVTRARLSNTPAVFWQDEYRPHDAEIIKKIRKYLPEHDLTPRHPDHVVQPRDALFAGADHSRQGHDLGHRQRAARLPHRSVPHHGVGHQRQDAVDRSADGGWQHVRDRRRRFGAEARQAARGRESPALGFARRIPRDRGIARGCRHQDRQQARDDSREDDGRSHGQAARQQQGTVTEDRRARQSRQPFLSCAVLGAGAGGAERRPGTREEIRAAGEDAFRERTGDSQRIQGGARQPGGYRRLLLSRQGKGRCGDAAVGHTECRAERGALLTRWSHLLASRALDDGESVAGRAAQMIDAAL